MAEEIHVRKDEIITINAKDVALAKKWLKLCND